MRPSLNMSKNYSIKLQTTRLLIRTTMRLNPSRFKASHAFPQAIALNSVTSTLRMPVEGLSLPRVHRGAVKLSLSLKFHFYTQPVCSYPQACPQPLANQARTGHYSRPKA